MATIVNFEETSFKNIPFGAIFSTNGKHWLKILCQSTPAGASLDNGQTVYIDENTIVHHRKSATICLDQ